MYIDDISRIDYRVWNCCRLVDIVIWFDLWFGFKWFHFMWFDLWFGIMISIFLFNDLWFQNVIWFMICPSLLVVLLMLRARYNKLGLTESDDDRVVEVHQLTRVKVEPLSQLHIASAALGHTHSAVVTSESSSSRIYLSLIHIWRCRRIERCRSRWSPYH